MNLIQSFLRRVGGTNRYARDGIRMERVGRDGYKCIEGDHAVLVQVEVQSGTPNCIIYRQSIKAWLPPHQNKVITDEDRDRLTQKVGRFIEYYGESFVIS